VNRDSETGDSFPILRCQQCGLTRTDFDPIQSDLSAYYSETYYGEAGKRFPMPIEWAVRQFRLVRVRAVLRHQTGPGRILDVGCGRGLMLAEFLSRGWEVVGIEFSAELAQAVQNRYGFAVHTVQHLTDCGFAADSLDVVMMWHSLEHLSKPVDALREVHRILRADGIAIIEVPNLGSWQAGLGGGRWFHLDAPRHLAHFSRDGLLDVAGDLGFGVREVQTLSLEYGPYGFLQTLLNRLTRQPNVLYGWLKGSRSVSKSSRDGVITLMALPFALVMGTLLEFPAVMTGRGGIVRVVLQAKKQ
jgi:SAM-dependent methyltransferase